MEEEDKAPEQLYLESLVANLTGWRDPRARLAKAFKDDEFILFGQSIVPLDPKARLSPRIEILVRMREEEKNLTPPGTFIPFLEYYDMMPVLDRWVVQHAILWWKSKGGAQAPALNINLSVETLLEPSFLEFVVEQMGKAAMPGAALCFELEAMDVASHAQKARAAAEKLEPTGCGIAIAGFGRDLVSFGALKMVAAAGMIKMDGALVREIRRDPVALAKINSIQGVCNGAGIPSVAVFVEDPETLQMLRVAGVTYAQGYGVARPDALN